MGLTKAALDRAAVVDYLNRAGQDARTSTDSVLDNLRLRLPDGSLCNAAALLFTADPSRFITGEHVKCGRFQGTTSVDFLDERTLNGNVFTQLDEALAFVARNTRQAIRITGRPEREIVPEYPDDAVREAIVNAICHRDYAAAGNVQVRIYDDRLEVWNPATLPADLTIEQLYREHVSRPRNRLLADAFYRARLIEQWGTGTLRMVRAFESRGLPRPEFLYEGGIFTVRFQSPPKQQVRRRLDRVSDRQGEAVAHMRAVGPMTSRQYAQMFDISERQALRDLEDLIRGEHVTRDGHGPSTRYFSVD
jgi:ATP-dependent DNA helicase RecG